MLVKGATGVDQPPGAEARFIVHHHDFLHVPDTNTVNAHKSFCRVIIIVVKVAEHYTYSHKLYNFEEPL